MDTKEFSNLVKDTLNACEQTLNSKGHEYAPGVDRLSNFKRAALARGVIPEDALLGMRIKHEISIDDMVRELSDGVDHSMQRWDQKIIDSINYLVLLRALLMDRQYSKLSRTREGKDDD